MKVYFVEWYSCCSSSQEFHSLEFQRRTASFHSLASVNCFSNASRSSTMQANCARVLLVWSAVGIGFHASKKLEVSSYIYRWNGSNWESTNSNLTTAHTIILHINCHTFSSYSMCAIMWNSLVRMICPVRIPGEI